MKTSSFTAKLMNWYRKNARDLPWRRTKDPYKIWISEIMLQQTTVNAVIPFYERWISLFPTIKDVAQSSEPVILKMWQGLGYYQRAKNIHKAAQIICAEYHEQIPQDPVTLRSLPGFGPYTVGAVLSIAFDQRQPIIDANVRRVVMRQLASEGVADVSQDPAILDFLSDVMPQKENYIFNQALMELGALVCRNREPLCLVCPVKSTCLAYEKGIQEIIPTPKKKIIKDIYAVIAVIQKGNKYLIQKRSSKGLLADLWEFPGGKIEKGETPREALKREVKEELAVDLSAAEHFVNLKHFYTQFRVHLNVWKCSIKDNPTLNANLKWVTPTQLSTYPMPSGSAKIVDKLLSKKLT
jgi:A/G-specific adenine glycosylase